MADFAYVHKNLDQHLCSGGQNFLLIIENKYEKYAMYTLQGRLSHQ